MVHYRLPRVDPHGQRIAMPRTGIAGKIADKLNLAMTNN